jgi:hypothetical protein
VISSNDESNELSYLNELNDINESNDLNEPNNSSTQEGIHLALVACGSGGSGVQITREAMAPIKSAILLSHSRLFIHLVVDDDTRIEFSKIVSHRVYRGFK